MGKEGRNHGEGHQGGEEGAVFVHALSLHEIPVIARLIRKYTRKSPCFFDLYVIAGPRSTGGHALRAHPPKSRKSLDLQAFPPGEVVEKVTSFFFGKTLARGSQSCIVLLVRPTGSDTE